MSGADREDMASLDNVATLLGLPVNDLVELERRPIGFAFLEGRYEQIELRDRTTGEILDITLSADGTRVDANDLESRNRRAALDHAGVLDTELMDLLLRHPELERIRVGITRKADEGGAPMGHSIEAILSARHLAELAADPAVIRITGLEDPVILDDE